MIITEERPKKQKQTRIMVFFTGTRLKDMKPGDYAITKHGNRNVAYLITSLTRIEEKWHTKKILLIDMHTGQKVWTCEGEDFAQPKKPRHDNHDRLWWIARADCDCYKRDEMDDIPVGSLISVIPVSDRVGGEESVRIVKAEKSETEAEYFNVFTGKPWNPDTTSKETEFFVRTYPFMGFQI